MVHNNERKSPAYELADPEIKQMIDMHVMAHMQFLTNETAATMAQSDQAAMGEMQDPGVMAALQAGVGLPLPENGMMEEQNLMDGENALFAGSELPPGAQSMPMMGAEQMMDPSMMDPAMMDPSMMDPNMMGGMPGMEGM
jgi:hypothetical protein